MDLLNKLKDGIDGQPEGKSHSTTASAHDADKPSILDHLSGSHHREERLRELTAKEAEIRQKLAAVAKEKEEKSGFFHSLHQKLDKEAAAEGSEEARDLEARESKLKAELAAVEKEKRDVEEGVLGKLKDKLDFDGDEDKAQGRMQEGEEKHAVSGLLDKITGKAEEEERLRKEEEAKNPLEKMKDRINEGMGGGKKAEEKEDFLDKTIDGFQKHVLKEGEQNDESALEQMKDEKIADILRGGLGLKDKDEDKKE